MSYPGPSGVINKRLASLRSAVGRAAALHDRWYGAILILAAPWLLFPSPAGTLVLVVVPGLWIVAGLAGRQPLPRTPLNAALLLLSLMVLVSLYATFDLAFSLPKVAGVLLGIASYFALVRWADSPARLRLAIQVFALLGGGLALLGLLGTNWFVKVPALGALIVRLPPIIRGLAGAEEGFQPNAIGGVLVSFIPLQGMLMLAALKPTAEVQLARARLLLLSVAHASLLVFTGGTLLLTQSRGAWLGLSLALLALLAWHSRRTRRVLAAVLLAGVVTVVLVGPQALLALASRQLGAGLGLDVASRLELWSRALYGIRDFPFTGMGMNTFRKIMPVLYPAFLTPPEVDVAHAHNQLLQAALDLGLPGLVAYLALWLGTACMLVVAIGRAQNPWLKSVAEGLAAGLMAHFVFGATDAIALGAKVGIVFWLALALSTSLFLHACAARPTAGSPSDD